MHHELHSFDMGRNKRKTNVHSDSDDDDFDTKLRSVTNFSQNKQNEVINRANPELG